MSSQSLDCVYCSLETNRIKIHYSLHRTCKNFVGRIFHNTLWLAIVQYYVGTFVGYSFGKLTLWQVSWICGKADYILPGRERFSMCKTWPPNGLCVRITYYRNRILCNELWQIMWNALLITIGVDYLNLSLSQRKLNYLLRKSWAFPLSLNKKKVDSLTSHME